MSPLRLWAALLILAVSPREQQPPIRSGTLTVEVDVTIQDGSGTFISDLRREDFELLEDKVPQNIDTVFLVSGSAVPDEARASSTPAAASVPVVPSQRDVFVFFVDADHISSPAALDRARSALREFLKKHFSGEDVGGVVAGGKMIGDRLTSNAEELIAATDQLKPVSATRGILLEFREWPQIRDELEAIRIGRADREAVRIAVARACSEDPPQCPQAEVMLREKAARLVQAIRLSAQRTLRSAEALITGLGRIPGRKTVIFFSDGFVVEERFEALASAVGRSGRTGVRFYTIDTRGLNRGPDLLNSLSAEDPAAAPARFDMLGDATNSLAVDTGGMAIRHENNFGRALEQIARDAGTYYVLGYRPARQDFDGKFRRVTVHVKRPGARVRARAGYLALPSSMPSPPATAPVETAPAVWPVPHLPTRAGLATDDLPTLERRFSPPEHVLERVGAAVARESAGVRVAPTATTSKAKEGWARYAKGDLDGARALLAEAAVEGAPVWVFYALGQSEFALRRFDEAIGAFTTVRTRMPDLREVYLDLADAYLQSGNVTSSLSTMRDAAARWPHDPEFQNAIGVLHVKRNALDEAIAAFSTAAQLAPAEPLAYFNLGRAYELRYSRGSRYVASMRQWIAPEGDRRKAAESYQRYLQLGGPYADQAREALLRLEWAK